MCLHGPPPLAQYFFQHMLSSESVALYRRVGDREQSFWEHRDASSLKTNGQRWRKDHGALHFQPLSSEITATPQAPSSTGYWDVSRTQLLEWAKQGRLDVAMLQEHGDNRFTFEVVLYYSTWGELTNRFRGMLARGEEQVGQNSPSSSA